MIDALRAAGFGGRTHAAASAASILYPSLRQDMVREGIALYGTDISESLGLEEAPMLEDGGGAPKDHPVGRERQLWQALRGQQAHQGGHAARRLCPTAIAGPCGIGPACWCAAGGRR